MNSLYKKCVNLVSKLNLNTTSLPKTIQDDVEFITNIEAGGLFYKFDNIETALIVQKDFHDKSIMALDIYKVLNINPKTSLHIRLLDLGEAVDISINFNFISYVSKSQITVWALSIIKRNFFTQFLNVSNVDEYLQVHVNSIIRKIIRRIKYRLEKNNKINPFRFFEDGVRNEYENEIYNTFVILKHDLKKKNDIVYKYYLKEINPRFFVIRRDTDNQDLYSVIVGNVLNCDITKRKWLYDEDELFSNNGILLYKLCSKDNIKSICIDENEDRIYLKPKKKPNFYSGLVLCGEQNAINNYSSVLEERKYCPNMDLPSIPDLEDKDVLN
ncbi:hypothetical protein Yalta_054 [Yalta virus]|nr:hypothetical protein Yalta_054 [Yalta virus]